MSGQPVRGPGVGYRLSFEEAHGDPQTRWQVSCAYADGMGRGAMTKGAGKDGVGAAARRRGRTGVPVKDNDGELIYAAAATRWVGTGRAVFDNKGQPIKQYEPYFSSVPDFEDEDELVTQGVTPILRYDPLGRLIRTDMPNGTYARSTFDAWSQTAWDPNDTTGEAGNAWRAARLAGANPAPTDEEQRAAERALAHADTPTTTHMDALGRAFLVHARLTALGVDPAVIVETRTEVDIEGQVLAVRDALGAMPESGLLGRVCAESVFAVGGQAIWSSHIDSGKGLFAGRRAGRAAGRMGCRRAPRANRGGRASAAAAGVGEERE